jgi:hypothetical protein
VKRKNIQKDLKDFPELRLKLRKEEAALRFNKEYRPSRSLATE